jgi:hypothetical protein
MAMQQRNLQMCSGLAVSSNPRGILRGKWRVLEYECGVSRKRGVVHQSCIVSTVFDEGLQQLVVHSADALLLNRAVHGKTRQLVSKANPLVLQHE